MAHSARKLMKGLQSEVHDSPSVNNTVIGRLGSNNSSDAKDPVRDGFGSNNSSDMKGPVGSR